MRGLLDRRDHPPGHRARPIAAWVDARDDDVELRQQLVLLVERAVVEDVDLDAGEHPERRQPLVELGDHAELLAQPLGDSPARP